MEKSDSVTHLSEKKRREILFRAEACKRLKKVVVGDFLVISKQTGIARNTLYQYVNGERLPSMFHLMRLKSVFPLMSLEHLITGNGKRIISDPPQDLVISDIETLKELLDEKEAEIVELKAFIAANQRDSYSKLAADNSAAVQPQ